MSLDFIVEDPLVCKRKRSSRACELCRIRKVRCDGLSPQCTRCQQENKECSYTITRKRGPKSLLRKTNSPMLNQMDGESSDSGKLTYPNGSIYCTMLDSCVRDLPFHRYDSWQTKIFDTAPDHPTTIKDFDEDHSDYYETEKVKVHYFRYMGRTAIGEYLLFSKPYELFNRH